MSQRELKQQLIRLGNQEPSLRGHLRAVLDALTTKTAAKDRLVQKAKDLLQKAEGREGLILDRQTGGMIPLEKKLQREGIPQDAVDQAAREQGWVDAPRVAKTRNAAAPYGSDESKWELIESEYDDNYLPAVIKLRKATDKMVGSFSHVDMGLSDKARNALNVFHDLRDAFNRVERFKRERNASKLRDTLNEILQAKKDRIGRDGNDIHQVSSDFRSSGYSALENAADSVSGVFNAVHRMLQKAKRIQ